MVAYSAVTANRAPLWIAGDTGLLEKYGLEVKLINIAAGNVALSALSTGDVHLITAAGPQVVAAVPRGAPIIIVSTIGGSLYQLVARPSIKTVQDLRGKVIGSSRIGAGTDFVLRRILDKLGLVSGKDVSLIPTGLSEVGKKNAHHVAGKTRRHASGARQSLSTCGNERREDERVGQPVRLWYSCTGK